MKKALFLTLVFTSLLLLVIQLASFPFARAFGQKSKVGIKVLSVPEGAAVFINDKAVGKTPFEDATLEEGEYAIKVQNTDSSWTSKLKPGSGTLAVVNRELSKTSTQSAGEVLILEKGSGVTVYSWPQEALVEIDGNSIGKTPLAFELDPGAHTFVFSRSGYLKRSLPVILPKGYKLNLNVDLAISEIDLSNIATPPVVTSSIVKVLDTPTGFLRVRDKPSTGGLEIAKVSPGDELVLLEEGQTWDKVRLSDGKEGYVSSVYVEKTLYNR